ncbi:MAG: hypothetical protein AB7O31_16680 [Burkholderiales bacterium]
MRLALAAALALAMLGAGAVEDTNRILEVDGDAFAYTVRTHPADAHFADAGAAPRPDSALGTAKLLNRYLSAGNIEDAALLSNEPKRRYQVLREFRDAVGEEEFRRLYTRYFEPGNRLVAEVLMPPHSLLVWHLEGERHLAGQYYVRIDERWFIDDVPSVTRTRLRQVLESLRAAQR